MCTLFSSTAVQASFMHVGEIPVIIVHDYFGPDYTGWLFGKYRESLNNILAKGAVAFRKTKKCKGCNLSSTTMTSQIIAQSTILN